MKNNNDLNDTKNHNQKFGKKEFLVISLMLFSMFFGAGNFIFPPMVGKLSGENFFTSIGFFCFTAVALPVLGVAAVAKAGSLKELASRANSLFAIIFLYVIYITIGPLLAIPRASNMPFEIAILPYLKNIFSDDKISIVLFFYSVIYFALNYFICLNPSKMIQTLGKYLTPMLLILIVIFFVGSLFVEPNIAKSSGKYALHPSSSAFIDGYQTMDAIAALVFGISVAFALKDFGLKSNKSISTHTIKAGIFAGAILVCVYIMIGFLGYRLGGYFEEVENGATLLSLIANYLFGDVGIIVLGVATFLACLTTTLGLIGACSSYFATHTKIKYRNWVLIWSVFSLLFANFGLNKILQLSVPILIALYPIAIVLIFLSLINNIIDSSKIIYRSCVYCVGFIGIINGFDSANIHIFYISDLIKKLPLYEHMLGWIAPFYVVFAVSFVIHMIISKNNNFKD